MTDKEYTELIKAIGELKTEIAVVSSQMEELKDREVPLGKLHIGLKEATILCAWIIIFGVTPALGIHYTNVNKDNNQDNRIESLEERQEVLYDREYDEYQSFNLN